MSESLTEWKPAREAYMMYRAVKFGGGMTREGKYVAPITAAEALQICTMTKAQANYLIRNGEIRQVIAELYMMRKRTLRILRYLLKREGLL